MLTADQPGTKNYSVLHRLPLRACDRPRLFGPKVRRLRFGNRARFRNETADSSTHSMTWAVAGALSLFAATLFFL
jgi:hypothetical protein